MSARRRIGPCCAHKRVRSHSAESRSGMQTSEIERSMVTVWVRLKRFWVGCISQKGCLELNAAGCDVGEYKASAEAKGKAGGFKGVSARRDVVHEIGLPKGQSF